MRVLVYDDYAEMSRAAARYIADHIAAKANPVIGLATGSTPIGAYAELVKMYRDGKVDFSSVTTFNLDEYCGLSADDPRSYHRFMREHLFASVNIDPAGAHVPDGSAEHADEECARYESMIEKAGGIDLQLLGIGMNGHIGFNEPGSSPDSVTRVVELASQTLEVNKAKGEVDYLPDRAISMGIGTIMRAREILLLANGEGKAEIMKQTIEGPVTINVPASILQTHPKAVFMLDKDAARLLARA